MDDDGNTIVMDDKKRKQLLYKVINKKKAFKQELQANLDLVKKVQQQTFEDDKD